jgi:hypothetical protein
MAPDWLDQARVLCDEGMTLGQITEELGVPKQRLSEWLRTDNHCVDCGTLLLARSERCQPCQAVENKLWTREAIILAIQEWAKEYGEPPAGPDWNAYDCRQVLGDEERALRHECGVSAGRWPWMSVVVREFGTWNAGIRAAGFESREAGGVSANAYRRRVSRAKAARLERRI